MGYHWGKVNFRTSFKHLFDSFSENLHIYEVKYHVKSHVTFDNKILMMGDTFMTVKKYLPSKLNFKTWGKFELK